MFRFVRDALGDGEYRYLDSFTRIGITHKPTNTRLRVLSSDAKRAAGIVRCPLLVADEPGAWNVAAGTLMFDMIQTALGKPGSPMTVVYIGTLAPATGGWWPALVDAGTQGSMHGGGAGLTWGCRRTRRMSGGLVWRPRPTTAPRPVGPRRQAGPSR